MQDKKLTGYALIAILFGSVFIILLHGQVNATDQEDSARLLMEGRNLSDEEAKIFEDQLAANPNNLSLRSKLLGYYFLKQRQSDSARKARQKHIMWIIQNHPEDGITGLPYANLNPSIDGEIYYEAKKLWLKHIETQNKNTDILGNAAAFFLRSDKDVAEDLFKRAQALEPYNPKWPERLGHLYAIGLSRKSAEVKTEIAIKSLEQWEKALNLTTEEIKKFYMLEDIAKVAFEAGDLNKAETYATELLHKSSQYKNWNYGNAIHHGNLILGRLALKSDELEKAKKYLIEAGKTTGSPQLNSFGPNMMLAKELLNKGEKDVVIEYFELCGNFWKNDRGRLKQWTDTVKKDDIPDFRANLDY